MSVKENFDFTKSSLRKWSIYLMGVGVLSFLLGIFVYGFGKEEHDQVHFFGSLLYNSIYMLLLVNTTMFFLCACTLAMGGWLSSFRRIPEAISAVVPVMAVLTLILLLIIIATHQHHVYHWLDKEAVESDEILKGKSGFLNPVFFVGYSVVILFLWILLGKKMRSLSYELDESPLGTLEQKKKYIFKSTVFASMFIVVLGLSAGSVLPWFWLMSINPHWYSTMYSWYTLISSFVAGLSLITFIFIYLKKQGLLSLSNEEHLHDLGKFLFAFSIFWTYLWFSQFMLIWYANIPEETVYFMPRFKGAYRAVFFINLGINFLTPFFVLMTKGSKRNYNVLLVMTAVLFIGHWLDFYQMVIPSLFPEHVVFGWYEIGLFLGFTGLVLFIAGRKLSQRNLLAHNHPFFKESIIHHT